MKIVWLYKRKKGDQKKWKLWWKKSDEKKGNVSAEKKKVLAEEEKSVVREKWKWFACSPAAVESYVAACAPLVRRAPTLVRIIFILKSLADNEVEDGAVDLSADELLNVLPSVHLVSQLTLHHVAHP